MPPTYDPPTSSPRRQSTHPTPSKVTLVWRFVCLLMTLFFFMAALFNINDSDWYLWVPIYGVPWLVSLPLVIKPELLETKVWTYISVIHLTLCCAYCLYTVVLVFEAINGQLTNPLKHEEGREMAGLLIVIAWLTICRFTNIGRPGDIVSNKTMMSALLVMTITLAVLPLFIWSLCLVSDWHTRLGHCKDMFVIGVVS
ncbi:hypothetical protein CHS0354_008026 [Potamilus streckersoni]|uniref:Transmembrane protein 220 n=1 Tax=Potamilus streckersoni TaxID=2493646 RepID=A0AAE0RLR2_9BIVA|nr:hypothetical protein CHS0354_008026 [Potamilus streckersoni]